MSDPENIDTIERPKKKRVVSEKQRAHLAKIQPKATEAKKKNKEIVQTVKKYEAVKKPIHDYTAMQHDLSLIKQYLTKEEARKIEKRRTKEIVDKAQVRELSYDNDLLFR